MDMPKSDITPAPPQTSQPVERSKQLQVLGLVATPQTFVPNDLVIASLARLTSTVPLECDHKETVDQVWHGISLKALIELAQPLAEAQYVRVHANNYTIPFALDEIDEAMLVETLNGQPLSVERGAPWRLYVPGAKCSVNVKWVEKIELSATRASSLEDRAARARESGRIPS